MHLLIQRVAQASVQIDSQTHGSIGAGLLAFVCAEPADTTETVYKAVAKLLKLRIFADEAGRMNRSVQDVGGGLLIVSQFTGRRHPTGQPPQLHRRCPACPG